MFPLSDQKLQSIEQLLRVKAEEYHEAKWLTG